MLETHTWLTRGPSVALSQPQAGRRLAVGVQCGGASAFPAESPLARSLFITVLVLLSLSLPHIPYSLCPALAACAFWADLCLAVTALQGHVEELC